MMRENVLRAAYHSCLAIGEKPSVRTVAAMFKRIYGKGIRTEDVRHWLSLPDTLWIRSKYERDTPRDTPPVLGLVISDTQPSWRDGHVRARAVIENSNNSSSSLRSDVPREEVPTEKARSASKAQSRKPKPDPDTSWIEPLIASTRPFKSVPLADLEADDGRAILGRYHALKFGNCCRNEHTNKLKGIQIAKGLATMSQHKIYGTMTVGQYVTCAHKVHMQRNGEPWFDPWLVIAFVDFEKDAA